MIWLLRNWQLALLAALAFALGVMGIRSVSLSNRLERAKAKAEGLQQEVKAHEFRNEVENRIAADRGDPRDRLRSDWSE